jgi:hypothetical protein
MVGTLPNVVTPSILNVITLSLCEGISNSMIQSVVKLAMYDL